eukprot:gene11993-16056_t
MMKINGNNPSSIVPPLAGNDPGYIIAESDGGLSNRLRVLAAYMHIGEFKYDGAHLVFIWDINNACPGHFLSLFQPIQTVIFATNSSRYVLDKHAKICYENSYAVFPWIMSQNHIPKNKPGYLSWNQIEYNMYSKFKPNKDILTKVINYVNKYNICNSSAIHIRMTDFDRQLNKNKKLNYHHYFRFIESRPSEEKIFLLTDNPTTQELFLSKYKTRILTYEPIIPIEKQKIIITNNNNELKGNHHNFTAPEEYRFTSLEHTLIDVLIASHARIFKPSQFSSLSELVKMFEMIGKKDRGWCTDSSIYYTTTYH